MKRLFVILALVVCALCLNYAEAITPLSLTYVSRNNTGNDVTNTVSTSTIIPGIHKILGFTVMPIGPVSGSNAGAWGTLYTGSAIQANLLGECESLANESNNKIFPYPKRVKGGGLIINQGAYSVVIIDYTR